MSKYSHCSLFYHHRNTCGPCQEDDKIYSADELKAHSYPIGEEKVTLFELIESRVNLSYGLKYICSKHFWEYGFAASSETACQNLSCKRRNGVVQIGPNASRQLRQYRHVPIRKFHLHYSDILVWLYIWYALVAFICETCRETFKKCYGIDAQIITIGGDLMWEIISTSVEPSKDLAKTDSYMRTSPKTIASSKSQITHQSPNITHPASSKDESKKLYKQSTGSFSDERSHDGHAHRNFSSSSQSSTIVSKLPNPQRNVLAQNNQHGLCGLENIGNTCFINSVIQCLSNIVEFKKYFVSGQYRMDLNDDDANVNCRNVVRSYGELLTDMWTEGMHYIRPYKLRSAVSRYATQFDSYCQEDAHEFLAYLLDALDEGLKTNNSQSSFISKHFHVCMQSNIRCLRCSKTEESQDSYNSLALSLVHPTQKQENTFNFRYVGLNRMAIDYLVEFEEYDMIWNLIDRFKKLNSNMNFNHSQIVACEITNENRIGEKWTHNLLISKLSGHHAIFYEIPIDRDTTAYQCLLRYKNKPSEYLYHPIYITVPHSEPIYKGSIQQFDTVIPNLFPNATFEIFYLDEAGEEVQFERGSKISTNTIFVIVLDRFIMSGRIAQNYNQSNYPSSGINRMTLENCIANLFVEQQLSANSEWLCSRCGSNNQAIKKNELVSIPSVLVFQLKRFHYEADLNSKINTMVVYPLILPVTKNPSNETYLYNLIAVCVHIGSLSAGHFFTYAKHHPTGRWYCFNDRHVTPIVNESCIIDHNAYILFYVRNSNLV